VIFALLVGTIILLILNLILMFIIYRWVKVVIEDFLQEKEYEYLRLIEDIEIEKTGIRTLVKSIDSIHKDYMDRIEKVIKRFVDVQWKDFDEKAKDIIVLYLKGYNINEIVTKLGVPKDMVKFTLMVAFGQEVDKDA